MANFSDEHLYDSMFFKLKEVFIINSKKKTLLMNTNNLTEFGSDFGDF